MLKYVFAFFAFILVSLAPLHADEGYIPYFPDFLEPDGIGFRGPAEIESKNCWSLYGTCSKDGGAPIGDPFVRSSSYVRASPITIEFRKNYFFKKLLYSQVFADFDQIVSNSDLRYWTLRSTGGDYGHFYSSDIASNAFLQEFLTSEEKSLLSSLESNRLLDLKTDSSLFILGFGLGLDLWIFEWSYSPFLMYYDTTVTLRSCKFRWHATKGGGVTRLYA